MGPLKSDDNRPNILMPSEDREIRYTEWEACENFRRNCIKCCDNTAIMKKRMVTNRDGESHTEYKIECPYCKSRTEVHLSRNLTIFDWDGQQEPIDPAMKKWRNNPWHV